MHIAFITAGGAGMFCGSCMQDNALTAALLQEGCEVSLLPTYTPIRVDQKNVSSDRVFLGGINLYLDNQLPGWRYLPRPLVSWLDHPRVLKWATSFGIKNNAKFLGEMTLAMLDGSQGAMQREYNVLVDYLVALKPDVILFSNALLSGVLPALRKRFDGPIVCLIQGDDIFLDQLLPVYRTRALDKLTQNATGFDHFLTHSRQYADYMADFLKLDRQKFYQIPLSIDVAEDLSASLSRPVPSITADTNSPPPVRIGYFARIAPEKGLLELVKAVRLLHDRGIPLELHAGGYLGADHHGYMQTVQQEAAFLNDRFRYVGSPGSQIEKMAFLGTLDLFSVPVIYQEAKGLYVLEALAAGVPVVLPRMGGLPELVESTQAGLVFEPGNLQEHADQMLRLINNPAERSELSHKGRTAVQEKHSSSYAARALMQLCQEWLNEHAAR